MVLLIFLAASYWFTFIYTFPTPKPFSGDKWYNPYKNAKGEHWKIGNFHGHSNAWGGLSNGKGTNEDMYNTYFDSLGYDILGISNYQNVDNENILGNTVRAYEHGYSPTKNHHIVLGTSEVSWKEYPLWQNTHHKQHVINSIREIDTSCLIAIAHPKRGMAFSFNDIKKLTNYDCLEVFNHLANSRSHWDTALSAGVPVFLLSNDDTHDHNYLYHTGRLATAVYSLNENLTEKAIIQNLKKGRSYAIEFYMGEDETFASRKKRVKSLPYLKKLNISNDTLSIKLSDECEYIEFYGQDGRLLSKINNSESANYILQHNDTYVRTEVLFKDSRHFFYLNPVFRSSDGRIHKETAEFNLTLTIIYRLLIGIFILVLLFIFYATELRKSAYFTPQW